jgi:hypothetical protein
MAGRIVAAAPLGTRTLVVAGNAHAHTGPSELGVPMGAWLAQKRPGVREIRVTTAADATTTCNRARSPGVAVRLGGCGFTKSTTRSSSICQQRKRRSSPPVRALATAGQRTLTAAEAEV